MEIIMSDIKPIRNNQDYETALAELHSLVDLDPALGSDDDAKIGVLSALIENYESSMLPDYQSDPIESIKLRLEQLGLKDKDLAPYLGSASRVSEVLAGKRPLTVSMIKNLEEGLDISASLLVGSAAEKKNKRWSLKTLKTMARRGYFGAENINLAPEKILSMGLLRNIFNPTSPLVPSLLRQSNYRDVSNVDRFHMDAWSMKVIEKGYQEITTSNIGNFDSSKLDTNNIGKLFKLSSKPDGVTDIITELKKLGIIVVIEPELPNTKLDGATFFTENNPIIGLTLRLSRMDNYWFTLAHELSHVLLHNNSSNAAFFDRLFGNKEVVSKTEEEADNLAGELLIPSNEWKVSPLRYASTPILVKKFAEKIGVHESVVAGRIRHDTGNWIILSKTVNEVDVKDFFGEVTW
jgi:HTH-type transcriptional regulator/antitoxin HigA